MLKKNLKITITSLMVIIIPFLLLMIINELPLPEGIQNHVQEKKEFYSIDFSSSKNIFLLGSSQIGSLNVTKINNQIPPDFTVYNLAEIGTIPVDRIYEMDNIISINPEIVFYGISYRDFEFTNNLTIEYPLPDPEKIISSSIRENFGNIIPENPQLISRTFLKNMFNFETQSDSQTTSYTTIPKTPFYRYLLDQKIKTDEQLRTEYAQLFTIKNAESNNIKALYTIVHQLDKAGIKIVIFTPPLHEYYLDSISDIKKQKFSKLLENLSNKYNISIYKFEERYHGLNIWSDISHISYVEGVDEFNDDVVEMINLEIEK
jgi:hypothetical protein|tara:strand:- start:289 stop:1242 length:954 start_codon:yes stop_codon:yes gene_type:complete